MGSGELEKSTVNGVILLEESNDNVEGSGAVSNVQLPSTSVGGSGGLPAISSGTPKSPIGSASSSFTNIQSSTSGGISVALPAGVLFRIDSNYLEPLR